MLLQPSATMKFNWGTGLAIFISVFVISMLFAVISSLDHRVDLVTENYYEEDLKFDQKADKIRNSNALSRAIGMDLQLDAQRLAISFPKELGQVEGTVHFFRPSDARLDKELPISVDTSKVFYVPLNQLVPGKWRIKIDYRDQQQAYYSEKVLVLP